MSHHKQEHSAADGEGEGFLDKVKDFFTGGDDGRSGRDHAEDLEHGERGEDLEGAGGLEGGERVDRGESLVSPEDVSETPPEPREPHPSDRVGEQPIDAAADPDAPPATDRPMNDSGADTAGSSASGWDGSDEPPELTVPENDAVRAHTEATSEDGRDDAGEGGSYESRHGSGVDDSGVLADAPLEAETGAETDTGARAESDTESNTGRQQRESEEAREDEERRERGEEFAREHDPETHDVEAGDEFRQRGDWTADEHGGPQIQEPDGTIHDPGTPEAEAAQEQSEQADVASGATGPEESDPEEVRDGGHGWGSAAPIEGGAMPAGHPVKAWHDTMTFVMPGEDGYSADPHEWFVDDEAARRAGFRHAHGG
ncbi:MAG: hypothetical protein ABR500_12205 [Dermatophilaceae bacterium]